MKKGDTGMADIIIEFKNIDKHFSGIHAVKNVCFSIEKGEVHTLIGENGAGKSTLMNMLSGMYEPDGGEILYHGVPTRFPSPLIAKSKGISTVYQELKLCPNLTVVENIFLGRELRRGLSLDWKRMTQQAQAKLDELGLEIDVHKKISELSTAQMQLVEISKAISTHAEVLILDEPTSSLTAKETDKLFSIVNQLKWEGVAILFISHRMEEVFRISDRISVMRNGEYLGTFRKDGTSPDKIISLIVGRAPDEPLAGGACWKERFRPDAEVALEVRALNRGKQVRDINFRLYKGEILGFYGLDGSGRTEVMETIYGLHPQQSGQIELFGAQYHGKNTRAAIRQGLAMLPEDRKHVGLFMNFNISDNIASIHAGDICNFLGLIKGGLLRTLSATYVQRLQIKCSGSQQMVRDLSGGNQQKVVISKCLSIEPRVLIMDEPTKGVDVGAKSEIYKILQTLRREEGKSILIVSSELQEIVEQCDRVLVMKNGTIVGELSDEAITEDAVLQLAFNG